MSIQDQNNRTNTEENLNDSTSSVCWKKVTIPKGLPALLEVFAKEVIRENPENIYEFLFNLAQNLLAKREDEEGGQKRAKLNDGDESETTTGKYNPISEDLAAAKIQAGFRGYQTRKSLKKSKKGEGDDVALSPSELLKTIDEWEEKDENENEAKVGKDEEKETLFGTDADVKAQLETIKEESVEVGSVSAVASVPAETLNKISTSHMDAIPNADVLLLTDIEDEIMQIQILQSQSQNEPDAKEQETITEGYKSPIASETLPTTQDEAEDVMTELEEELADIMSPSNFVNVNLPPTANDVNENSADQSQSQTDNDEPENGETREQETASLTEVQKTEIDTETSQSNEDTKINADNDENVEIVEEDVVGKAVIEELGDSAEVNGEKYSPISEDLAAAKIQAGFRGYQTRKSLKKSKTDEAVEELGNSAAVNGEKYNPISEDLAAAKIQAGFRGYQTRKSLKKSKTGEEVEELGDSAAVNGDEIGEKEEANEEEKIEGETEDTAAQPEDSPENVNENESVAKDDEVAADDAAECVPKESNNENEKETEELEDSTKENEGDADKSESRPNSANVEKSESRPGTAKENIEKSESRPSSATVEKSESRPVSAKENEEKSESRPSSAKEDVEKPESRPVSAKESEEKSESRPVSAKESEEKSESRPVSAKESEEKSESRPVSAKESEEKSESRPVSAKKSEEKSESRPSSAKDVEKSESRPVSAKENEEKSESRPSSAKEDVEKSESRLSSAKENEEKSESRPVSAKENEEKSESRPGSGKEDAQNEDKSDGSSVEKGAKDNWKEAVKKVSLMLEDDDIQFIDEDAVVAASSQDNENDVSTNALNGDLQKSNKLISNAFSKAASPVASDDEKTPLVSSKPVTPDAPEPVNPTEESPTPPVARARGSRKTPTESTPLVAEAEESAVESPVLRRSQVNRRNKATTSKYRSGFVMEDSVSLDDMEAQIENEVLNQAATKIQAGFRGFKTRKTLHGLAAVSTENEDSSDGLIEPQTNNLAENECIPAESSENPADDTIASTASAIELNADALPENNTNVADASAENANFTANDDQKTVPDSTDVSDEPPVVTDNNDEQPPSQQPIEAVISEIETKDESAEVPKSPPPTSDTKETTRMPLVYLRSRSYPGSTEEDLPEEFEEEMNDDVEMVDIGKVGEVAEGDENDNISVDLELDEGYINSAATKIQANIRGFLVRKSLRRKGKGRQPIQDSEEKTDEIKENMNADESRVEEDITDCNSNEENEANQETDETTKVAATKIQAGFRGFKDRQKIRQKKQAAITIQATVRGFLTRRRLAKARRKSLQRRRSSAKSISHDIQILQKANLAATKIQSVYRGYQVRSRLSQNMNTSAGDE